MYIVKWLMGHPLAAIWALGVLAILLAMGSDDKNNAASDTDNNVAVTNKDSIMTKEGGVLADNNTLGNSSEVIKSNLASADVSDTNKPKVQKGTAKEVIPKALGVDTKSNAKSSVGPFKVKIPGDSQREEAKEKPSVEISDLGQTSTEEMLLMAREAYWNNGLDEAAQIYLQLIEKEPSMLEYKGELGNVYWRQGYPKKAAELYSEIAIPLIDAGSAERVMNMIGFIRLFYPDRVSVIVDRLERIKK